MARTQFNEDDFNDFFNSYLETALWSSSDPDTGEPLDQLDVDFTKKVEKNLRKDALKFYKENLDDITSWAGRQYGPHVSAGHDFWLTRNGHGAGFWDGDWPEPAATRLTEASKRFGTVDLYTERGKVYAMGFEGADDEPLERSSWKPGPRGLGTINNPDYKYYVVDPDDLTIVSGWEYKEDARDAMREEAEDARDAGFPAPQRNIYTAKYLRSKGADPDDDKQWYSPSAWGQGQPFDPPVQFDGAGPRRYTKLPGPREGTRVRFSPNPASYRLYSDPPPLGDVGKVTTVLVPGGRRTYMRGPGGGLVYVNWNRKGVQGVALQDLEKV